MPRKNPPKAKGPSSKSVKPPSSFLRRAASLPKNFKLPKSPLPSMASIKRWAKKANIVRKEGIYGLRGNGRPPALKGQKGAGFSKEAYELKEFSPVARGSRPPSPGGGVKETQFNVTSKSSLKLKSFVAKSEMVKGASGGVLQMDAIPPGTTFTPPKIHTFNEEMKAKASELLAVKPAAPGRYPTLDSIKSGEALKQAYGDANPIGHITKALKGDALTNRLTSIKPVPSLGGQSITSQQLFKNIKGGVVETLDGLKTEVAIAQNRRYLLGENGRLFAGEPYKEHLARLKETNKALKVEQKKIKKIHKNGRKAVSKQIDEIFRRNRVDGDHAIKTARLEMRGLKNELRSDLKWIQKTPVASNTIPLKELGGGGQVSESASFREKYKPQSEADRAAQFNRRWHDGRADIARVDQKITDEVSRIKQLRKTKNQLKKQLSRDVSQALGDVNTTIAGMRGRVKSQLGNARDNISREKAAARAARMRKMRSRLKRFIRF